MPTGYTSKLHDGEQTFPQFAATCARAFGALVMLRDEPSSDELPPDTGGSDTFYKDRAIRLEREIAELENASLESLEAMVDKEHAEAVAYFESAQAKHIARKARYLAMIAHARDWAPPTPDHEGMKKFMLEQLQQSIDFDCSHGPTRPEPKLDAVEWKQRRLWTLRDDLQRSLTELNKDTERNAGRNKWLEDLRSSLNTWGAKGEP